MTLGGKVYQRTSTPPPPPERDASISPPPPPSPHTSRSGDPSPRHTASARGAAYAAKQRAKRSAKRDHVIAEIIGSEKTYLAFLRTLESSFVKPIQALKRPNFENNAQVVVFINALSQIVQLNSRFLRSLEEKEGCVNRDVEIAEVFTKFSKVFTIYGQYSRNYGTYFNLVQAEQEQCSSFREFIVKRERENNTAQRQSFASLLIMPVQRIPRYILVLRELSKTSSHAHESTILNTAISEVSLTADHINNAIKEREDREKIFKLEESFRAEVHLVAPHRRLLVHGKMKKLRKNGIFSVRTFHLFSDILIWSEATPLGLRFCGKLELRVLWVEDRGTKEYRQAFRVCSPGKSVVVCPQNELHKRKWLKSFAHALRPYQKEKEALRRLSASLAKECVICRDAFSTKVLQRVCHCCMEPVCYSCSPHQRLLPFVDVKNFVRVCINCDAQIVRKGELIDLLTRVGIWTSVDNANGPGGQCLSSMWASVGEGEGDTTPQTQQQRRGEAVAPRMPLANFVSMLARALTSQSPTRNFSEVSVSQGTERGAREPMDVESSRTTNTAGPMEVIFGRTSESRDLACAPTGSRGGADRRRSRSLSRSVVSFEKTLLCATRSVDGDGAALRKQSQRMVAGIMLSDEFSYLDHMDMFVHRVARPLMHALCQRSPSSSLKKLGSSVESVSASDIACLMSCVETIRDLSRRLSSDLARDFRVALVQRRPLNFGRIMLDYSEYFDAHVRYASYLSSTVVALLDPSFSELLHRVKLQAAGGASGSKSGAGGDADSTEGDLIGALTIEQYLDKPAERLPAIVAHLKAYIDSGEMCQRCEVALCQRKQLVEFQKEISKAHRKRNSANLTRANTAGSGSGIRGSGVGGSGIGGSGIGGSGIRGSGIGGSGIGFGSSASASASTLRKRVGACVAIDPAARLRASAHMRSKSAGQVSNLALLNTGQSFHQCEASWTDVQAAREALRQADKCRKAVKPFLVQKNWFVIERLRGQFKAGGEHLNSTAGRSLLFHGKLIKVSKGHHKTYRFHLFSDILTYSAEGAKGFELHRILPLLHLRISDHTAQADLRFAFHVDSMTSSFDCVCADARERYQWLKALRYQIDLARAQDRDMNYNQLSHQSEFMIDYFLENIRSDSKPKLREAFDRFEWFYFHSDHVPFKSEQITRVYLGDSRRKLGLVRACGLPTAPTQASGDGRKSRENSTSSSSYSALTSAGHHAGLKKLNFLAVNLLDRLLDHNKNSMASAFLFEFLCLPKSAFDDMSLPRHLQANKPGSVDAARRVLRLLQSRLPELRLLCSPAANSPSASSKSLSLSCSSGSSSSVASVMSVRPAPRKSVKAIFPRKVSTEETPPKLSRMSKLRQAVKRPSTAKGKHKKAKSYSHPAVKLQSDVGTAQTLVEIDERLRKHHAANATPTKRSINDRATARGWQFSTLSAPSTASSTGVGISKSYSDPKGSPQECQLRERLGGGASTNQLSAPSWNSKDRFQKLGRARSNKSRPATMRRVPPPPPLLPRARTFTETTSSSGGSASSSPKSLSSSCLLTQPTPTLVRSHSSPRGVFGSGEGISGAKEEEAAGAESKTDSAPPRYSDSLSKDGSGSVPHYRRMTSRSSIFTRAATMPPVMPSSANEEAPTSLTRPARPLPDRFKITRAKTEPKKDAELSVDPRLVAAFDNSTAAASTNHKSSKHPSNRGLVGLAKKPSRSPGSQQGSLISRLAQNFEQKSSASTTHRVPSDIGITAVVKRPQTDTGTTVVNRPHTDTGTTVVSQAQTGSSSSMLSSERCASPKPRNVLSQLVAQRSAKPTTATPADSTPAGSTPAATPAGPTPAATHVESRTTPADKGQASGVRRPVIVQSPSSSKGESIVLELKVPQGRRSALISTELKPVSVSEKIVAVANSAGSQQSISDVRKAEPNTQKATTKTTPGVPTQRRFRAFERISKQPDTKRPSLKVLRFGNDRLSKGNLLNQGASNTMPVSTKPRASTPKKALPPLPPKLTSKTAIPPSKSAPSSPSEPQRSIATKPRKDERGKPLSNTSGVPARKAKLPTPSRGANKASRSPAYEGTQHPTRAPSPGLHSQDLRKHRPSIQRRFSRSLPNLFKQDKSVPKSSQASATPSSQTPARSKFATRRGDSSLRRPSVSLLRPKRSPAHGKAKASASRSPSPHTPAAKGSSPTPSRRSPLVSSRSRAETSTRTPPYRSAHERDGGNARKGSASCSPHFVRTRRKVSVAPAPRLTDLSHRSRASSKSVAFGTSSSTRRVLHRKKSIAVEKPDVSPNFASQRTRATTHSRYSSRTSSPLSSKRENAVETPSPSPSRTRGDTKVATRLHSPSLSFLRRRAKTSVRPTATAKKTPSAPSGDRKPIQGAASLRILKPVPQKTHSLATKGGAHASQFSRKASISQTPPPCNLKSWRTSSNRTTTTKSSTPPAAVSQSVFSRFFRSSQKVAATSADMRSGHSSSPAAAATRNARPQVVNTYTPNSDGGAPRAPSRRVPGEGGAARTPAGRDVTGGVRAPIGRDGGEAPRGHTFPRSRRQSRAPTCRTMNASNTSAAFARLKPVSTTGTTIGCSAAKTASSQSRGGPSVKKTVSFWEGK